MIQQNVLEKFKELFGTDRDIRVYFAPGRVNLIGEHTDYNGVPMCSYDRYIYGSKKESGQKTSFLFYEF